MLKPGLTICTLATPGVGLALSVACARVAAAFCTWSIVDGLGSRSRGCSVSRSFCAASGSDSMRLLAWSLSDHVPQARPPTSAAITAAAPSARGTPARTRRSTSGVSA